MFSFPSCLHLPIPLFTRLVSHTLPGVFSIIVQLKLPKESLSCSIWKTGGAVLPCRLSSWCHISPHDRAHSYYEPVTSCEILHIEVCWMLECICWVSHYRTSLVGWCLGLKEMGLFKQSPCYLPPGSVWEAKFHGFLSLPHHITHIFTHLPHCRDPSICV